MRHRRVIMSDLHGRADKLEVVMNSYETGTNFVVLGDMIDRGPDSREVIDMLMGANAMITLGNHEWMMLAALYDTDTEPDTSKNRQKQALFNWLATDPQVRMENNVLKSYGIDPDFENYSFETNMRLPRDIIRDAMRKALHDRRHDEYLMSGMLFYESEQEIGVHAGIRPEESWRHQRQDLDAAESLLQSDAPTFLRMPPQLWDFRLAREQNRPQDMQKTLITGHDHLRVGAEERLIKRGREVARVFLASRLDLGDPLFVYDATEKEIRAF